MAADVARWLNPTTSDAGDEIDRLLALNNLLENYGFYGEYRQVIDWYHHKEKHGSYPFGRGTYEDQPAWLLLDFQTLELLQEQADLQKRHGSKRNPAIPKFTIPTEA